MKQLLCLPWQHNLIFSFLIYSVLVKSSIFYFFKKLGLTLDLCFVFFFHCCCSVTYSCQTLCNLMDCSTPGFPVFHHLPELAQTHVHWFGDAIQPSYPISSLSAPAFNLSQNQGPLKWVSTLHIRWPKYWNFSFSPSNEYSGLISFRIDWFDLFADQGTLKSLF